MACSASASVRARGSRWCSRTPRAERNPVTVTTVDPSTGEPLEAYDETAPDAVDTILQRAHEAAAVWRATPSAERAEGLRRLAASLRDRREELALMATREMG